MRDLPYFRLFSATIVIATSVAVSIRADDIFIWAQETVSGVTINYEGSIDLTGFPKGVPQIGKKGNGSISPSQGLVNRSAGQFERYQVLPGNGRTFGTGASKVASGSSGDLFGLTEESDDHLNLDDDYTSHDPISGTFEFLGESLASLGIVTTPFAFKTTAGDNTIRMFTSPAEFAAQLAAEAAAKADLLKQIQKLKKKAKKLKKKGKKAKAKKLGKKAKKLKAQLLAPG